MEEALDELKEGVDAIAERQKHIRIADQSEYHWRTVEAYKSGGIADSEEDAKKLKQAEKSAEQEALKERQKAAGMTLTMCGRISYLFWYELHTSFFAVYVNQCATGSHS